MGCYDESWEMVGYWGMCWRSVDRVDRGHGLVVVVLAGRAWACKEGWL